MIPLKFNMVRHKHTKSTNSNKIGHLPIRDTYAVNHMGLAECLVFGLRSSEKYLPNKVPLIISYNIL